MAASVIWTKKTQVYHVEKDILNMGDLNQFIIDCKASGITVDTQVTLKAPFTVIAEKSVDVP